MDKISVGFLGVGSAVPEKVLNNSDLEKMVDTSDEWITKRTGISERRILDKGVPAYELGIEAARKALDDSGLKAEDIDLIIVATETPDYLTPATSCTIQGRIGAINAAAFDINAACSGFVYGITVASQFMQTGYYKNALVIGCEGLSRVVDWSDRNTCVLFGDGAGAAVLGAVEAGYGILATNIGTDGSMSRSITIPGCYINEDDMEKRSGKNERTIWMDGNEVFKFAVKIMSEATKDVLEKSKMNIEELSYVVPHQANIRIIKGAAKRLGLDESKVIENVKNLGNISSASIPVALEGMAKEGKIKKGDNVVLVGFGGGLTWASALIKWSK